MKNDVKNLIKKANAGDLNAMKQLEPNAPKDLPEQERVGMPFTSSNKFNDAGCSELPAIDAPCEQAKDNRKLKEPELFVDSHHGKYAWKIAWEWLAPRYKQQAREQGFTSGDEAAILNVDNEWHYEAANKLENMTFTTPLGEKFTISQHEDIWLIPTAFLDTIEARAFFGD